MGTQTLNKWAELLLDTGKRNNLINFRNTKSGTAEIVAPDVSMLFAQAEHSAEFEVFAPQKEFDEGEFLEDEQEDAVEHDETITREAYQAMYSSRLKKGQVLVYTASNKPLSTLKNISKRGRAAIEETGVNILYLAFGFVHWTEDEHSKQVMKAPLLLLPISIENDSALDPYTIKIIDDEVTINPTFSYKLQNEYGIKLPDFDDDIDAYFSTIEEMVKKLKWTVSRECKIGLFSFLKLNMYQDLVENADQIVQSPNVRALMGETPSSVGEGSGAETSSIADLLELHNVVDADSSQAEAIAMAAQGKSFVLQGPPGTGKSQTITNIIAECLAKGKKVLFVSEKLAALSVVYEKLKAVGLEEFCLELHSHKANKKQIIEELCRTLQGERSSVSSRAQAELQQRRSAQRQLDTYATELHRMRTGINKTLYQLYELVAAYRNAPDLEFAFSSIRNKGEQYIDEATTALERYVEYTISIGYDYHKNVWYGVKLQDSSYQMQLQLKNIFRQVQGLCASLQQISKTIEEELGIAIDSLKKADQLIDLLQLICEAKFIVPEMFAPCKARRLLPIVRDARRLATQLMKDKTLLDSHFEAEIYENNGKQLYLAFTKLYSNAFVRFFSGDYRKAKKLLRMCCKDNKAPTYKQLVEYLEVLTHFQQNEKRFNECVGASFDFLGASHQGYQTNFVQLEKELSIIFELEQNGFDFGHLPGETREQYLFQKTKAEELLTSLQSIIASSAESKSQIIDLFDRYVRDIHKYDLEELSSMCSRWTENLDQIDHWISFQKTIKKLQSLDILAFVDFAIENQIESGEIVNAFLKLIYKQWVIEIWKESHSLIDLSRISHDEAVEELAEGIKAILKENISAEKIGLFRLIVQQLGFSRMGDAILSRMEEALKSLSHLIEDDGTMLSLRQ